MDFLNRIDWFNHDGVNLGMINDFVRNQFYDRIIAQYVPGQNCTDIGFGTGLLSMLALKHGAKHIRAFESDPDRYLLGCEVIDQLKLGSKIELINERYDRNYQPTAVTFTETVNGNLWWEGLWNSLPVDNSTFLPGQYFLEIWAVEVPRAFAQGLCRQQQEPRGFSPGVDVDENFVNLINGFRQIGNHTDVPLPQGIVKFRREQETDWGWVPYMRAVQAGKVVGGYVASNYVDGINSFQCQVPTAQWRDSVVLLVPRMGMQQDQHRLYLDTGHWGPGEDPILLVNPEQNLLVSHNVFNGTLTWTLEQK